MMTVNSRCGGPVTADERRMLVSLISNGSSRRAAARYVGIHPATLGRLLLREPQFREEVIRAEANVEIESLQRIRDAAKEPRYWRAAAWLLERRNPAEFGQRPGTAYTQSDMQAFITFYCDQAAAILPPKQRAEFNRLVEVVNVGLQEGVPPDFLAKHWKYVRAWRPWESGEYEAAYVQERTDAAEVAQAKMCGQRRPEEVPLGPPETSAGDEFAPGGRYGPPIAPAQESPREYQWSSGPNFRAGMRPSPTKPKPGANRNSPNRPK